MKHIISFLVLMLLGTVSALAGQGVAVAIHPLYYLFGFGAVGLVANEATIISLQKNYRAIFQEAFDAIETTWQRTTTQVPSKSKANTYNMVLDVPRMKEWFGDKVIEKLKGAEFTIVNRPWEASFGVDEDDVEDDNLGMTDTNVKQLADEGKRHPDELVSEIRKAGEATKCWDDKNFYAANHQIEKSGVQSNLLNGTGVTLDKISADIKTVRSKFRSYKTSQGKPLIRKQGKLDILFTIPVALESIFDDLKNMKQIAGTDNTLAGTFDYVVDPYLTSETEWYADYVGSPVRAFLYQVRKAVELKTRQRTFENKTVKFGIEARYNVGYLMWPFSIKVKNA